MRKIFARSAPFPTFKSPREAIQNGIEANARLRQLPDEAVRGKMIQKVLWNDTAISLKLSDSTFFVCEVRGKEPVCKIAAQNPAGVGTDDPELAIDLGSLSFVWDRAATAAKYEGRTIGRLWFADWGTLIYVRGTAILWCSLMWIVPDDSPLIYWSEVE